MNEENQNGPGINTTGTYAEPEALYDLEHRDWVLQTYVGVCNLTGLEVPVTLNIAGAYISGHIVKPEIYFDGLRSDLQFATFSTAGPKQDTGKTKSFIEQIIAGLKEPFQENAEKTENRWSDPANMHPRYIHLRNARFFLPNDPSRSMYSRRGIWWRGKIEAVDGFYFGLPFPA